MDDIERGKKIADEHKSGTGCEDPQCCCLFLVADYISSLEEKIGKLENEKNTSIESDRH